MRALLIVCALGGVATASPFADLRVKKLPAKKLTLRMRTAQPAPQASTLPSTSTVEEPYVLRRRKRQGERRSLAERVIVRLDVGLAVDGAKPSGQVNWDHVRVREAILADPSLYASVRSYGFSEIYLGTSGIGMASLSSYLSSQTRFARASTAAIAPIMSPYDTAIDQQTRAIWVESDGLFTSKWLAPIRARAGRMYVYGAGIVHTDGLVVAWEKDWIELSSFTGLRVPDFRTLDPSSDLGAGRDKAVTGSDLRIDLRRFKLPILVTASTLRYDANSHSNLAATWVPRRDMVVRSTSRFRNGTLADQRLVVRSRLSAESTVIVDSRLRTKNDWFWDYASLEVNDGPNGDLAARSYLGLGAVSPRLESALIAGTVIAQNVDVLARGAIALDTSGDKLTTTVNPHLPAYVEGGAAVEVRVRRALAVSGSVLIRDYSRPPPQEHTDVVQTPVRGEGQELPDPSEMGEESLVESGVTMRYSAGARRFSVQGELYGRQTRWAPLYDRREWTPDGTIVTSEELFDLHGGGRITLEAWVSPQVRLRGEYDVSTQIATSPEFRGLKALRLLLEGTY